MSTKTEWKLRKESELRCEVKENEVLSLRLTGGNAEVFGVEMAPNKEYTFRDQNLAVFTWYGCTLESWGTDASAYESDTTPMISYVMIVGPPDHGKSTVAQILTAYAVRLDRSPVFVDLDPGQGQLTLPGCIGAAAVNKTHLSVEEGLCNFTPLVYYHGHFSPKDNAELFKALVTTLAEKVHLRLERDADTKASGIIVNTSGWTDDAGFDLLLHSIAALQINIVLVMGSDKLQAKLAKAVGGGGAVTVVPLAKSGGINSREAKVRTRLRKASQREYFYGRQAASLTQAVSIFSPERKDSVPWDQFVFVRVGGVQLSSGMRVISDSSHQDTCKVIRVAPSAELVLSFLAVLNTDGLEGLPSSSGGASSASAEVPQQLLSANVAGFVHVVAIDVEARRMTLLYPCGGTLPSNYLMVGNIKMTE